MDNPIRGRKRSCYSAVPSSVAAEIRDSREIGPYRVTNHEVCYVARSDPSEYEDAEEHITYYGIAEILEAFCNLWLLMIES